MYRGLRTKNKSAAAPSAGDGGAAGEKKSAGLGGTG